MLIHFGVKPYIVFDGDYLPSKAHTEKDRAARRKESRKLGLELLAAGRVSQAHLELQKAVDVTPSMARELIEELKRLDVPYVVAPYEADSQLAYLEKQGTISGVLSEDSDLLVFGVKCLLTKLDQYGECVMINRADFTACREVSLVGWTDNEFRMMSMLSGCDYLPGIGSMGLKTAYRLVRKHKTIDRVIRTVQFDGKKKVPSGYLDAYTKAERTFLYQWVFCPEAQCLVNLNPVPSDLNIADMPYIGKPVEPMLAVGVANGDLDPNTKEPLPNPSRLSRHPASRTRVVQTPDEKQGKSIEEFFKPKRTPLAELDPNSFTPSPSQQRLLANQRSTSWSASQAQPLRPQALNRVSSLHTPLSAPQPSRRTVSAPFNDRHGASPKRQRLCSESMLAASMQGSVGLKQTASRFFAQQTTHDSPSLRKASNKKKDDFELWSDDSVAEVAAELTATQEAAAATANTQTPSPKKRKKVQVFADSDPQDSISQQTDGSRSEVSQKSVGSTVATDSQSRGGLGTPDTSFEVEEEAVQPTIFSKGIATDFAALKSKYSFQPSQSVSRRNTTIAASKKPLRELRQPSLVAKASLKSTETATTASNRQQLDPHKEARDDDDKVTEVPASSPIMGRLAEHNDIDDAEWLALEHEPVRRRALVALKGSEDMIVPNSPESGGDDGRVRPKIDFARFAFAG